VPDVTFEWENAKITVREQTGQDVWRLEFLQGEIQAAYRDEHNIKFGEMSPWDNIDCNNFAEYVLRSTVKGDIGVNWVQYEDCTRAQMYVMFDWFKRSPKSLIERWKQALAEADLDAPDPEELPGDAKFLKKSQKESPAG
jgi:hypothetical protein